MLVECISVTRVRFRTSKGITDLIINRERNSGRKEGVSFCQLKGKCVCVVLKIGLSLVEPQALDNVE